MLNSLKSFRNFVQLPLVFGLQRYTHAKYCRLMFTALHGKSAWTTATRKPTVCQSVKWVDCNKTEESSVQIFIPDERPFSL